MKKKKKKEKVKRMRNYTKNLRVQCVRCKQQAKKKAKQKLRTL